MHLLTGLFLGEMLLGARLGGRAFQVPFEVVHALPGRLRVRLPKMVGNGELAATLEQQLKATEGVQSVRCNETSGSVLICHRPEDAVRAAIVANLREAANAEPSMARGSSVRQRIREEAKHWDERIRELSSGHLDAETLLAAAAGLWGVKTVVSPGVLSRFHGVTLLFWAYSILRRDKTPPAEDGAAPALGVDG